jgi:hypothetical protein
VGDGTAILDSLDGQMAGFPKREREVGRMDSGLPAPWTAGLPDREGGPVVLAREAGRG